MKTKPSIQMDIQQAENLAAQGLTNEQIAAAMGFSESTLYKNKKENKDFQEALMRGRARGIAVVTNRFFEIIQAKIKYKDEDGNDKEEYKYDADTRLNAMKFFMERRGGWVRQEQSKVDLRSSDGSMSPLDVKVEFVKAKQEE